MPEENTIPESPVPVSPQAEPAQEEASQHHTHDREMSCQNCGAPLDYMEGESVITCPYCGTTTMLAGYDNIVKIDSHSMLPMEVNENDAISTLLTWLSKGFHRSKKNVRNVKVQKVRGLMLPYWIVKSSASTSWSGKKKRTKTTGNGDNKKTKTWWEPVSGTFSDDFTWPEYARENTDEFWGVDNIKPGRKAIFPDWGKFWLRFGGGKNAPNRNMLEGQLPFDIEQVKKCGMAENLVNGQVTQERAEANARNNIKQHQDKKARKKADVISDVDTTVNVTKVDLVYVPLWEIQYSAGGKTYNALVNGTRKEVLSAEYPVSARSKITIFDIFLGIPAAVLGIVGFAGNGPGLIKAAFFVLLAAILAYSILKGLSGKN